MYHLRIRTKNTIIFFLFCLLSLPAIGGERLPSLLVSNAWELVDTSKGKPEKLDIKAYKLTFSMDGTWHYISSQGNEYGGFNVKGSGTWMIEDTQLIFTVGDNKGKSKISISNGQLSLSPDPVLLFDGKEAINTTYIRSKQAVR